MKKAHSVKWKMIEILLLCWLLPVLLMMGLIWYYIFSHQIDNKAANLEQRLVFNNQICEERLNSAVAASRIASYDGLILDAYQAYEKNGIDRALYKQVSKYLVNQYQRNICFMNTILWFYEEPSNQNYYVYNEQAGGSYQQIRKYWQEDHKEIVEYTKTLDTNIGFIWIKDKLYLVRNLVDHNYRPFAAFITQLNTSYCFSTLTSFPLGSALSVEINDERIQLQGETLSWKELNKTSGGEVQGYQWKNEDLYLYHLTEGTDYKLIAIVEVKRKELMVPVYGYHYILIGMLLGLGPLLWILLKMFGSYIGEPIGVLVDGAEKIQTGNLGYQLEQKPKGTEFQFLNHSFNQMSKQLKYQFDHIYEEELALRDAKIMALQSHINPHFMNNTLEIINWEARMAGNAKVSQMIEALGVLMDGAMDRKKRPEVLLSEEMVYVDAYLSITATRLGKRLIVKKELEDNIMQYLVPRLILQPVIENAIDHGVIPNGSGTVVIRGRKQGDFLLLEIENDGTLTDKEEEKVKRLLSPDYDTSKESFGNMGIANVNQRLRILYGPPCGLTISRVNDAHILARLTIAVQQKDQ